DPVFTKMNWIMTDEIDARQATEWRRPDINARTTALLQYTSGTTRAPRGVVVSYQNLAANQYTIQLAANHMSHLRPGSGVCWLPQYHDMGLMASTLLAVFVDGPCYFMSPLQF